MIQTKLTEIGSLIKTHGIHGNLVLNLNEHLNFDVIDKSLVEGNAVFVERDGIPVPFFISENGIKELNLKSILLKFDDIDDRKALQLVSSKVFLESSKIDKDELSNNEIASEWVDYEVTDIKGSFKGIVLEFIDLKGNPMLNIDVDGKTLLIPLFSDFISAVDDKNKKIVLDLPVGYLEALL